MRIHESNGRGTKLRQKRIDAIVQKIALLRDDSSTGIGVLDALLDLALIPPHRVNFDHLTLPQITAFEDLLSYVQRYGQGKRNWGERYDHCLKVREHCKRIRAYLNHDNNNGYREELQEAG